MNDTTVIDQYFSESKKVIAIVLENEASQNKAMKASDKLALVKEHKEKAGSAEVYEELERLEKELERKIRFNQLNYPAIPEEHREKIKRNAAVELLAVDEKLNELKATLKDRIEYLEKDLLPLINDISHLESLRKIPNQIDILLNSELGENQIAALNYRLRLVTVSNNETQSGKAAISLKKVIESLRKIEVPIETKGLLNSLKRGKK